MRDAFDTVHPAISFFYFAVVLLVTMMVMHPVFLMISLAAACTYALMQNGRNAMKLQLKFALPLMILTALINPLFNHAGVTMLCYLPWGNPLTLESTLYGLAAGTMFAAVVIWFSNYNRIMTADKIVFLFGRMLPSLSLLLSMTMRFVPRFQMQMKQVSQARSALGLGLRQETFLRRMKDGAAVFSITMTWALENAANTADSMRSRGYGLQGRTAYAVYRFDGRDRTLLTALIVLAAAVFLSLSTGSLVFRFYPMITITYSGVIPALAYLSYGLFCAAPILLNLKEQMIWRSLQFKI